jgi:hypothetical protein
MVCNPPVPLDRESVTPFRFVKASLPTVPLVAASETVQELLVTVGTVYEANTVWFPLFDVLKVIVMPFAAVKARRPTVAEVAVSETVQLELVRVGPEIVTVDPFPDRVMLLPPLKNRVLLFEALKVVVPAVFPAKVMARNSVK